MASPDVQSMLCCASDQPSIVVPDRGEPTTKIGLAQTRISSKPCARHDTLTPASASMPARESLERDLGLVAVAHELVADQLEAAQALLGRERRAPRRLRDARGKVPCRIAERRSFALLLEAERLHGRVEVETEEREQLAGYGDVVPDEVLVAHLEVSLRGQ